MTALVQDLRFALRAFRKNPGFAAAAVLSLAIGIGANSAIFSVASALLLRPLPYADPDRLVILWNRSPGLDIAEDWFSTAQYFDIKSGHGGFDQLAIPEFPFSRPRRKWTPLRPACAGTTRIFIPPTAASPSASCRCSNKWWEACAGRCSSSRARSDSCC